MSVNYSAPQGTTWKRVVNITMDEVAYDATDMDIALVIKAVNNITATPILEIPITWTDQSSGIGLFELTKAQTLALGVRDYYYEIFLYDTDENKSLQKGVFSIITSLGQPTT